VWDIAQAGAPSSMVNRINQPARLLVVMAALVTASGCSFRGCSSKKDIAPEDQLHSYITTAVNVTSSEDKEKLIELTSGELRRAISSASEEAFQKAYIEKKYDFRGFELVERRDIEPGKTLELDFRLNYKSWSTGEEPDLVPFVETLNRAVLTYEHGRWVISNVQSLETSFDWEVGLPLDNVDTTGITPETPPVQIRSSREEAEDEATPQETGAQPEQSP
jgi:hypothetical protein